MKKHSRKRRWRPTKDQFSRDWTNFHSMRCSKIATSNTHWLLAAPSLFKFETRKDRKSEAPIHLHHHCSLAYSYGQEDESYAVKRWKCSGIKLSLTLSQRGAATAEGLAIINITAAAIKMKCKQNKANFPLASHILWFGRNLLKILPPWHGTLKTRRSLFFHISSRFSGVSH